MRDDICPHCGQPWKLQRHKTVKALAAYCLVCAERRQRGINWYAQKRHEALEQQAAQKRPWAEKTEEERERIRKDLEALCGSSDIPTIVHDFRP